MTSPSGVLLASYERAGEVKTGTFATTKPSAVELVDRTVLGLAFARPDFRAVLQRFVRGSPGALLLVEFSAEAGDDALPRRLDELAVRLAELGHPDSVVRVEDRAAQAELWNVRQGGLSIVMISDPAFPWNGLVGVGGFVALGVGVLVAAFLSRPGLAPKPAQA